MTRPSGAPACCASAKSRSCSTPPRRWRAWRSPSGDRLAIVTNGGGAGVLATDRLIEQGGHLATLSDDTIAKLNAVLPPTWSHANPIDIIGDADAERYGNAVTVLMQDDNVDGLLVMYCPTAISTAAETAQGLIGALARPELARQEECVRLLDGRSECRGWPRKIRRRADAGLRDAGTRGARLHVSGALPPEPATAAGDPILGRCRARRPMSSGRGTIVRQVLDDGREWLDAAEATAFLDLLRHSLGAHRSRAPMRRRPPRWRRASRVRWR